METFGGETVHIRQGHVAHNGTEHKGEFVEVCEGDNALAVIRHFASTDRLRWRLTALRPSGGPVWTVNEEDLKLNKDNKAPLVRLDEGFMSVMDLDTGDVKLKKQL